MEFPSDDHQNLLNNDHEAADNNCNTPPHSNPSLNQPSNGTSSNPPPSETSPPPPPPPQVAAGGYQSFQDYPPPPPSPPTQEEHNYYFGPQNNMPPETFIEGHIHETNNNVVNISEEGGEGELGDLASKPTFRIVCKASGDRYNVAIRNGIVMLTKPDPTDLTQQWIKDERFSTKVKDAEGNPSFALVNKGTGHAVKHSYSGHPVQLIPFRPILDVAILWTESKDLGDGYRTIRMINNVKLVLDAFNGDSDHGGVHVGTVVALYECWKGDNQNQQWKMLPF